MNILELFAGSRSIGKAAESRGHNVFSVDINNFKGIDYVTDILNFDYSKIPFIPDVVWASPPCTYFSVASIGHHWNKDHTPKTKEALLGMKILNKTIEICKYYEKMGAIFYIENPTGKMRRKVKGLDLVKITYCSYGDNRMKPTDIWSNNHFNIFNPEGWQPRGCCFAGNYRCHHEAAPRGSKTGTQGVKGNYERSKIPVKLCIDIIQQTERIK